MLSTTHTGAFCCLAFFSVTFLLAELAVLWFYHEPFYSPKIEIWSSYVFLTSFSESVENRCAFGLFISSNAINQALETKIFQQVGRTTPCSPSASDLTLNPFPCPISLLFEELMQQWSKISNILNMLVNNLQQHPRTDVALFGSSLVCVSEFDCTCFR